MHHFGAPRFCNQNVVSSIQWNENSSVCSLPLECTIQLIESSAKYALALTKCVFVNLFVPLTVQLFAQCCNIAFEMLFLFQTADVAMDSVTLHPWTHHARHFTPERFTPGQITLADSLLWDNSPLDNWPPNTSPQIEFKRAIESTYWAGLSSARKFQNYSGLGPNSNRRFRNSIWQTVTIRFDKPQQAAAFQNLG